MNLDEKRKKETAGFKPVKKVLVIQGSPRGKTGRTEECLQPFLDGVRQAGAEAEVVYLNKKKINHCLGCFTCWLKTPGVCVHKDDMAELIEKMRSFDTLVMAQPLYIYVVPGLVKDFLDRSLPMAQPFMTMTPEGKTTHPSRWPGEARMVVFSVCGFPEVSHFDPLVEMFRRMWASPENRKVIVGEILRPEAESLTHAKMLATVHGRVMDAFERAGRELVDLGYITEAAEKEVQTPISPHPEAFHAAANAFWRASIDYYQAKREGAELPGLSEHLSRRPEIGLAGMAYALNPEAAGDLEAVFQFDISGEHPGWYYLEIKDGLCYFREGKAETADLTVHTPWDVWLGVSQGSISGQDALMEGKYQVEGELSLLLKMNDLFSR